MTEMPNQPAALILDYLRRERATMKNVQSHFGLSRAEALKQLEELEQQGAARRVGAVFVWEAVGNG